MEKPDKNKENNDRNQPNVGDESNIAQILPFKPKLFTDDEEAWFAQGEKRQKSH